MAKTQAERAREYRRRQMKRLEQVTAKRDGVTVERDESVTVTERDAPSVTEPGNNTCKACGRPTGHRLVVKCGPCCWGTSTEHGRQVVSAGIMPGDLAHEEMSV